MSWAAGYRLLLNGASVTDVGSGVTSYVFEGLSSGTSYELGIYALGDGVMYGNGPLSSVSVTTEVASVLASPSLSLETGGVRIGGVAGASSYAYRVVQSGVFDVIGGSLFVGGSYLLPIGSEWTGELEVKAVSSSTVILDSPWVGVELE